MERKHKLQNWKIEEKISTADSIMQKKERAYSNTGYLQLASWGQEEFKKSEESLHELWDTSKQINIWVTRVPEEKRERKGQKVYLNK